MAIVVNHGLGLPALFGALNSGLAGFLQGRRQTQTQEAQAQFQADQQFNSQLFSALQPLTQLPAQALLSRAQSQAGLNNQLALLQAQQNLPFGGQQVVDAAGQAALSQIDPQVLQERFGVTQATPEIRRFLGREALQQDKQAQDIQAATIEAGQVAGARAAAVAPFEAQAAQQRERAILQRQLLTQRAEELAPLLNNPNALVGTSPAAQMKLDGLNATRAKNILSPRPGGNQAEVEAGLIQEYVRGIDAGLFVPPPPKRVTVDDLEQQGALVRVGNGNVLLKNRFGTFDARENILQKEPTDLRAALQASADSSVRLPNGDLMVPVPENAEIVRARDNEFEVDERVLTDIAKETPRFTSETVRNPSTGAMETVTRDLTPEEFNQALINNFNSYLFLKQHANALAAQKARDKAVSSAISNTADSVLSGASGQQQLGAMLDQIAGQQQQAPATPQLPPLNLDPSRTLIEQNGESAVEAFIDAVLAQYGSAAAAPPEVQTVIARIVEERNAARQSR